MAVKVGVKWSSEVKVWELLYFKVNEAEAKRKRGGVPRVVTCGQRTRGRGRRNGIPREP